MKRGDGNPPLLSTQAPGTAASTTAILAKITGLQDANYEVRWAVGGSSNLAWALELATSTTVGSGTIRDVTFVFTGTNLTPEYIFAYKAEAGDCFRVHVISSVAALSAAAKIQAERLI